jgi:Rrf2 family protein
MFSKSCQYAIRAILFLAVKTDDEQKIGVKEIAEALQVPQQFLAKILQQLVRAGFLSSIKGPHGGFYLSEENRSSSLASIIDCIDGSAIFNACVLGLPECSAEKPCTLHHQYFVCREGLRKLMVEHTVDEMATGMTNSQRRI